MLPEGKEGAISMEFPPEFDPLFYQARYEDLGAMSRSELQNHYNQYGIVEGRLASPAATRQGLISLIPPEASVLEIGPFCNAAVKGQNVRYFDVLDRRDLIVRAEQIGLPFDDCPHIDYVSSTGDLSIVHDSFDFVVACHSLAHHPDLIRHLADVERILDRRGAYFIVAPDKRYCLNFFLAETTIAEVIDAHARGLTVHSLASVIEHRALITHNEAEAHWRGEHGVPRMETDQGVCVHAAVSEYEASNGAYIDVDAWHFTPRSFRALMRDIKSLNYSRLEPTRVYNPLHNKSEFCAILQKDGPE
jgi:SAM-dependent methyltransferase